MIVSHFDRAVAIVLEREGVLSDDKNDPGGITKYGISKRAYPALDIASLTKDQAIAIYRKDYWDAAHCNTLPFPMALAVFDAAVNQGVGAALGMRGRAGDDLVELMAQRGLRYARNDKWPLYGHGWLRRLFIIHAEALKGD